MFSFISLFNSALHITGDKSAHPQEHFLTVYTAFGSMHLHCCRPVPRLRRNLHCTKSCTYSQKELLRMGKFAARNKQGWIKKTNKRKHCCISLVAYIVVLRMQGHTNLKVPLIVKFKMNGNSALTRFAIEVWLTPRLQKDLLYKFVCSISVWQWSTVLMVSLK